MTKYMEYTKGGDILIAPSLDCKHQYVFSCELCEQMFAEIQVFFSHYLSHYETDASEEDEVNGLVQSLASGEKDSHEDAIDSENENRDDIDEPLDENDVVSKERVCHLDGEKSTDSFKDSDAVDGSVVCADKTSFHETDMDFSNLGMENEYLDAKKIEFQSHDGQSLKNVPSAGATETSIEEKIDVELVKRFMKSKENVCHLITAYKNQPQLWDYNLPVDSRKMETRKRIWTEIALQLKHTKDLDINSRQVAACIIYLRQRYRQRKRSEAEPKKNDEILPTWVFNQMQFLKPFVENNPIDCLDIHQDLAPKQTIHLLNILKRCAHLWDTSTIEYYCTNIRSEALTQMKNIIMEEMDLEVDVEHLQKYINCVRDYFSSEKRRQRAFSTQLKGSTKYYDLLLFLQDHVGPFQCSYCQSTMLSPLGLRAHESQHTGTMAFECPECKKEFNNADTYVYHIRRHMGDLNHECKLCGKRFIRALEVTEHMRRHTGDKPFCCEICGASFSHRTGFARHKKIHIKKYQYFCPYCSKGFYTKESKMNHMVVHTNERNFVCSICGKAFKTKMTLKSHIATHENGNYECNICGKSAFKNKINLWQHKRKHRLNDQIKTGSPSPIDKADEVK